MVKQVQKDDDFVKGAFRIWNLTLSKELKKRFRAQIGIHNLFNYTDSQFLQAQLVELYLANYSLKSKKQQKLKK